MMRSNSLLAVIGLLGVVLSGCSGNDAPEPAANRPGNQNPAANGSVAGMASGAAGQTAGDGTATDPIAKVAADFLDAVVQGDTQRATQLLTPKAIARFKATDLSFASPELGAPEFKIGEVRRLSDTGAAANCQLTYEQRHEEMVCLLRLVDSGWRVAGIALEIEPGNPVSIDFEQMAPSEPPQVQSGQFVEDPTLQGPAARTASEPAPTAPLR